MEHVPSPHFALAGTLHRATPIHGDSGKCHLALGPHEETIWCPLSSLSQRLNYLVSSLIWRQGFYLEGNTTNWTKRVRHNLETEQQTVAKGLRWRNMCLIKKQVWQSTEKCRARCNLGLREQAHKTS